MSITFVCSTCKQSFGACTCPRNTLNPAAAGNWSLGNTSDIINASPIIHLDGMSLAAIRAIVAEEIRRALVDESEAEEAWVEPRLVRLEGKPTARVQCEYEGVLYEGEVFPVERKWT